MKFNVVKSSSIYETFSPLYKALKLLGIMTFQLNLKTGEIAVKFWNLLWTVGLWSLCLWIIVSNVQQGAREHFDNSVILLTGWHWLMISQLIFSCLIQLMGLVKRKSSKRLFEIINEVDSMVSY